MIKCDGKLVSVGGTPPEMLQDFINVTRTFRNALTQKFGKEKADALLVLCGQCAVDDESNEPKYAEQMMEIIKRK